MDSFSYHSKFELCKMKVVICISVPLSRITLGMKDFKYKNCALCLVSKNVRLPKMYCSKLCYNATKILNIPYQSMYFMDGLTV